jgi:xanthine dehydrogenase iron-sulfur cluster and FAD-binding subunit A
VVRCPAAEGALKGRVLDDGGVTDAQAALVRDISPIDDLRSTAEYRRRVAQNLLAEFLKVQA